MVIEEGVKIVETAGGPQAGPIIKLYKQHGVFVIHKVSGDLAAHSIPRTDSRLRPVHFYSPRQIRRQARS